MTTVARPGATDPDSVRLGPAAAAAAGWPVGAEKFLLCPSERVRPSRRDGFINIATERASQLARPGPAHRGDIPPGLLTAVCAVRLWGECQ